MGITQAIIDDARRQGIEEGIEIGIKIGIEQTRKEKEEKHWRMVIQNLRNEGLSDEKITTMLPFLALVSVFCKSCMLKSLPLTELLSFQTSLENPHSTKRRVMVFSIAAQEANFGDLFEVISRLGGPSNWSLLTSSLVIAPCLSARGEA